MKCDYKIELNYKGVKREFIIPSLDVDLIKNNSDVLSHVKGEVHSVLEGNRNSSPHIQQILDYMRDIDAGQIETNPNIKDSVNNFINDKGIDFNNLRNHVALAGGKYSTLIKELISPITDDNAPGIHFALRDEIENEVKTREYTLQDLANDNKGKIITVKYPKFDKEFKATITGNLAGNLDSPNRLEITTSTGKKQEINIDTDVDPRVLINVDKIGTQIPDTSVKQSINMLMGKHIYDRVANKHKIILYVDEIPKTLDILKDDSIGKTIAHELVHFRVDRDINAAGYDTDKKVFTDPDMEILNQMKSYFFKNVNKTNTYKEQPAIRELIEAFESIKATTLEANEKHNLREFAAYASSEDLIKQAMSEIPFDKGTDNLLQIFSAWAAKSLGLSNTAKPLMSKLPEVKTEILDVNKNPEEVYYDDKKADLSRNKIKNVNDISEFTNHSGGANGADTTWDEIGFKYGMGNNNHYYYGNKTPKGNVLLNDIQITEGISKARLAGKSLGKTPSKLETLNLLGRNWFQVKNADAIFAIGTVNETGVEGGTGWAVQMAIDAHKPVNAFDQSSKQWYKYDYTNRKFIKQETPVLTENFAGIGTRQLNDAGKQAIEDVYKKTISQGGIKSQKAIQGDMFNPQPVKGDGKFIKVGDYKRATKKDTFQRSIKDNDNNTVKKDEEGYKVTFADHPNFNGHVFKTSYDEYMFIEDSTGMQIAPPSGTPNTIKGLLEGVKSTLNNIIDSSHKGATNNDALLNQTGIQRENKVVTTPITPTPEIPKTPVVQADTFYKPIGKIERTSDKPRDYTIPDAFTMSSLDESGITVTVKGYPLSFEGHPNIDAILIKEPETKNWMIVDRKSGLRVGGYSGVGVDIAINVAKNLNSLIAANQNIPVLDQLGVSKLGNSYNPKSKNTQSFIKSTDSTAHVRLLVNRLRDVYSLNFRMLNSEDIANIYDTQNNKLSHNRAFVSGKDIVINTDLASMADPLHELGHIVLAGMKSTDPDLYDEMISTVQSHPRYNDIASNYPELTGNDLHEEVFTTVFGERYRNLLKEREQRVWEGDKKGFFARIIDNVKNFFKGLFGIKSPLFDKMEPEEVANLSLEDIISRFGDKMLEGHLKNYVDDYVKNIERKTTDFKTKLKESNILNIECYG